MEQREVKESAPAKVNLALSVGGKRQDGYHEILTLMETVSLCDELTVRVENGLLPEIKLSVFGDYPVSEDPSNLVVRAAETFFASSGDRFPISVTLLKRIPTEAGLGGGSADAAAALRALNRLAPRPLSPSVLSEIAVKLGADVAFCLFGGTAICSGIGETIEPVADPAPRHYVVVMGRDRVSTPAAYRALDSLRKGGQTSAFPPKDRFVSIARGEGTALFNDFESVVFPEHPGIAAIKERLLSLGAIDALMTGSGAAVFGIFSDFRRAEAAAASFFDAAAFAVSSIGFINKGKGVSP